MKKLSISEQCKRAGIDRTTYYTRLKRGDKDLFAPIKNKRKPKRKMSAEIRELLKKNNIQPYTYYNRLDKGWTEFEASNVRTNAHIYHYYKGKTVRSYMTESKYQYFLFLVNRKGLSTEEALHILDNPATNAKYYRDGMTLHAYCKKHGLSYNVEYRKLMLGNK